jgi:hypothetical protein
MAINVGPNLAKPSHHVKLSRGSTSVGLILCDMNGRVDERHSRDPFPSTAIKTYTGDATHSDREPPFREIIQQDWSLGRGQEVFEDDVSRYQDGKYIDTTIQGKIILGPEPTFSKGIRDWGGYMPGKVVFKKLLSDAKYLARKWTTTNAHNCLGAEILIRKIGTPSAGIDIFLYTDNAGEPGTQVRQKYLSIEDINAELLSLWVYGIWSAYSLSASTPYHIVVRASGGADDEDNCWEIGCAPYAGTSLNSNKSPDGSSWTSISDQYGIYFRAVDGYAGYTAHFIEYRDQLYFAKAGDGGAAAKLFMNGDRGACDVNSGNLDRLVDSTKTGWATWKPGNIAKIVGGNAFQELQQWRTVTGNFSGYLTVFPSWKITHDINDEYVILGSDDWMERTQSVLTKPATDIEVANDIMYIAQGAGTPMYMHREVNDQGIFRWTDDSFKCWYKAGADIDFIISILDYISGPVLWMGRNSGWLRGDASVFRDKAPVDWMQSPIGYLTIFDGKSSMNEQSIANVTVGIENKIPYIDVAEAFTTGVIASEVVSPAADIRFASYTVLKIKSSIDVASGVLELLFDDTANCASPIIALPLPALRAGAWTEPIILDIDATSITGADAVISVGFRLTQDIEAVRFDIRDGVRIYTQGTTDPIPIRDTRITALERYGEPETCWILAEDQVGEIRNGLYQPVPLREIASAKSDQNGKAHLVHDVYLYFSLKDGLEKYYQQHLDDIGPNRDLGMPTGRRGPIIDLAGYPGRIYAAIDGGDNGKSCVMCYNKGGWHEIYRSRFAGRRIRKIYIQSIPGYDYSRLWISEEADVLWIPISLNPLNDANYPYTHEGTVITSRIHGGMQDIAKFLKAIKLATKNLSTTNGIQVQVDYRTDTDVNWTRISNAFTASPYQEEDISSSMNVSGRWVEFRLVLQTEDNTTTPEVLAWVLKAVQREEEKYANTYTFRAKDWDRDLQGDPIDETVSTLMSKLETLVDNPLPMLVNTNSDLDDSKYAVAQPYSLRQLRVVEEEEGREVHVCQVILLEI